MFLSGDDNLSTAERARMDWIAARLHWLGLAIQQATVSGMFDLVAQYDREKRALQLESAALRAKANAVGGARQESAEAGIFGINNLLADLPKYAMLAGAAYLAVLYFSRRGR